MNITKQYPLPGIDTFWLIPAEGASLDDVIDHEMVSINTQEAIILEVLKDSVQVISQVDGEKKTQKFSAFHSGDDNDTKEYLAKISRQKYFILARERSGGMYLLNTEPTEFMYREIQKKGITGEQGFSIEAATVGQSGLVKVLYLSLNVYLIDSNLDALIDSNGDKLTS